MRTVDLETAKALQELGYDGEYTEMWCYPLDNDYEPMLMVKGGIVCANEAVCPAPRIDDAAYWIRDKHRISIETLWWVGSRQWEACAYDMDADDSLYFSCCFEDYDSALEAAVSKAIEIIKSQKQ